MKLEAVSFAGLGPTFSIPIDALVVDHDKNARFSAHYDVALPDPQHHASSLRELADSMLALGQLQPCIVVKLPDSRWELRAGFRRYSAAKLAHFSHLLVAEYLGDPRGVTEAENTQKALLPVERAFAIHKLVKEGLKEAEIAKRLAMSPGNVQQYRTIMRCVHPMLLDAWKRAPGAFTYNVMVELSTLSQENQLLWYQEACGLAVKGEKTAPGRKSTKLRNVEIERFKQALTAGKLDQIFDGLTSREVAIRVIEYITERKEIIR